MDDALDEQHVFAWLEQFFKFDSRQDQDFFAPKEIVRDMLQHDEYLASTMKSQTGARAINNCIIDIIRDMLDQPPRHEISTQYAYGTDPNKPRSSRQQKARCYRYMAVKDLQHVRPDFRTQFDKLLRPESRRTRSTTEVARVTAVAMPQGVEPSTEQQSDDDSDGSIHEVMPTLEPEVEVDKIDEIEIISFDSAEDQHRNKRQCSGFAALPPLSAGTVQADEHSDESGVDATDAAMDSCLEADIIATALFDPYAGEGLVYMPELYSGTATCVRQMLHRFGSRLRALIVDCVPAQECGVADIAKDFGPIIFYKYNVGIVTFELFKKWYQYFFQVGPEAVSRIHASFCCETFGYINLCNENPPQDKHGRAQNNTGHLHSQHHCRNPYQDQLWNVQCT